MNHNWLPFSLDILEVQRVDIGIQFNYVSLQIGKFDSINLHVHVHVLHVCIYTLLPDIHVHVISARVKCTYFSQIISKV